MRSPLPSRPAEPAATALIPVSLAAVAAALLALARLLGQPHPQLLIDFDCGAQPCRRQLGGCYFLSQLVLLRQRGASGWLCNVNVNALRHRYLRQLGLDSLFFLVE